MPAYEDQHYVSKFWIKKFRDGNNRLYALQDGIVKLVGVDDTMTEKYLYTIFNNHGQMDQSIEHALGAMETIAGLTFMRLCDPALAPGPEDRDVLCQFLGLQACRHPDVLNRGRRLAHGFAATLRDVANYPNKAAFATALGRYGILQADAEIIYDTAIAHTPAQLQAEYDELIALSPQDPQLPLQDALRAHAYIASSIAKLRLELVEAGPNEAFILGDTPMPQEDIGQGFTVPLGQRVALVASPGGPNAGLTRRAGRAGEVNAINRTQKDTSLKLVVGADPTLLRSFA